MKIYNQLTPCGGESAVALGNFDGLHLGHQKVIASAVAEKKNGLVPTVFTFTGNPQEDLGGRAGGDLITQEQKIALLEELGVEQLYLLNFTALKDLTAEDFVSRVLSNVCRAKAVCCGFNFTFGRGGSAGSPELEALCAQRGIQTEVSGAVLFGGEPVSSTRIRALIAVGDMEQAAQLLGRPYSYVSEVVHGKRLGRELGTPTLNQVISDNLILPRFGVYISRVFLNGAQYAGVTNVGVNPTVGGEKARAETWMPDYSGPDFYGETVRVDFVKFLRPEVRFPGLEELKAAILKDGQDARIYFAQAGA